MRQMSEVEAARAGCHLAGVVERSEIAEALTHLGFYAGPKATKALTAVTMTLGK